MIPRSGIASSESSAMPHFPRRWWQLRVAEIHHDEERRHVPARLREHAAQRIQGGAPVDEVIHRDDGLFTHLALDAATESVGFALPAHDEGVDGCAPAPALADDRRNQRHRRELQAADLEGQTPLESVPERFRADLQNLPVEQGRPQVDEPPVLVPERRDDALLRSADHGPRPDDGLQAIEPRRGLHPASPTPFVLVDHRQGASAGRAPSSSASRTREPGLA